MVSLPVKWENLTGRRSWVFSVANRSYVRFRRFSFADPLGLGTGGNLGLRGGAVLVRLATHCRPANQGGSCWPAACGWSSGHCPQRLVSSRPGDSGWASSPGQKPRGFLVAAGMSSGPWEKGRTSHTGPRFGPRGLGWLRAGWPSTPPPASATAQASLVAEARAILAPPPPCCSRARAPAVSFCFLKLDLTLYPSVASNFQ